MTTKLVPLLDSIVIYDASEQELGAASLTEVGKSILKDSPSSELNLTEDPVTGQLSFTFDSAALVPGTRQVIAGDGLSGGGSLSADVTVSLDVGNLTSGTTVDVANDQMAFVDVTSGQTLKASISTITDGVVDPVPLGSII